jgi:hypothetical protein
MVSTFILLITELDLDYSNHLKSIVSVVSLQFVQSVDYSDSVSRAFHLLADGSSCYTQDFVSSGSQHHLGDSVCELLALRLALLNFTCLELKFPINIVADSFSNIFRFINAGFTFALSANHCSECKFIGAKTVAFCLAPLDAGF